MTEEKKVRVLGLPPMTDREYKILKKRQEYIDKNDLKGLEVFNAKLEGKNKKVEQEIQEEVKEDSEK